MLVTLHAWADHKRWKTLVLLSFALRFGSFGFSRDLMGPGLASAKLVGKDLQLIALASWMPTSVYKEVFLSWEVWGTEWCCRTLPCFLLLAAETSDQIRLGWLCFEAGVGKSQYVRKLLATYYLICLSHVATAGILDNARRSFCATSIRWFG